MKMRIITKEKKQKNMPYLIDRYEPCPCGSEKKFKFCCYKKKDKPLERNDKTNLMLAREEMKKGLIKKCFYPGCEVKGIQAHSIQRSKMAKYVADNGMIGILQLTADDYGNNQKIVYSKEGVKKATTFSGFCGDHDKQFFQPIEDEDFVNSAEQRFLYSFRSFAREYHKRREQMEIFRNQFKDIPSMGKIKKFVDEYRSMQLSESDDTLVRDSLYEIIENKDYDKIDYVLLELDYNYGFSCSVCVVPYIGIDGEILNNIYNYDQDLKMKFMFVNVFIDDNKTYCLLSWLKSDDYDDFKKQFQDLDLEDKKKVISNIILYYSENFVLNPTLWHNSPSTLKQEIIHKFQVNLSIQMTSINSNLLDVGGNLFEIRDRIPKKLYHYVKGSSLDINNLKKCIFYFSPVKNFNDIFDCKIYSIDHLTDKEKKYFFEIVARKHDINIEEYEKFSIDIDDLYDDFIKKQVKKYYNNIGAMCFSEEKKSLLMWGHYADSFSGMCLEYVTNESSFWKLKKVEYIDKFPLLSNEKIISIIEQNSLHNELMRVFFTKSEDWKYEKEWRLIHRNSETKYFYKPNLLTGIYFGPKMDEDKQKEIIHFMKEQNPDIKFYKGRMSDTKYEIVFDPIN